MLTLRSLQFEASRVLLQSGGAVVGIDSKGEDSIVQRFAAPNAAIEAIEAFVWRCIPVVVDLVADASSTLDATFLCHDSAVGEVGNLGLRKCCKGDGYEECADSVLHVG